MAFTFDEARRASLRDDAELVRDFRPSESVIVALGAGGLGAVAGLVAALALGALEAWAAAAIAAPIYLAAVYLTERGMGQTWRDRDWLAFALSVLLLTALAAWPLTMLYSANDPRLFWAGPIATLVILTGVVISASGRPRQLYRAAGLAFLIAALAANQSFLAAVGV